MSGLDLDEIQKEFSNTARGKSMNFDTFNNDVDMLLDMRKQRRREMIEQEERAAELQVINNKKVSDLTTNEKKVLIEKFKEDIVKYEEKKKADAMQLQDIISARLRELGVADEH